MKVFYSDRIPFYFLRPHTDKLFAENQTPVWIPFEFPSMYLGYVLEKWLMDGITAHYKNLLTEFEEKSVVCFFLTTLGDYHSFILFYLMARQSLKQRNITLVVGGSFLNIVDIEEMDKQFPDVDHLIVGPGEKVFGELLKNISEELETKKIIKGAPNDKSGLPDASIAETSMGYLCSMNLDKCSWGLCKFCHHLGVAQKSGSIKVEEFSQTLIKLHRDQGVNHFQLFDNSLLPDELEVMLKTFQKANLQNQIVLDLFGVRLNKNFITLAPLAKELNIIGEMAWGMEVCSQKVLNRYAKGTKVEQFRPILSSFAGIGVKNLLYILLGLPTMTEDDIKETFVHLTEMKDIFHEIRGSWFLLSDGIDVFTNRARYGVEVRDKLKISDNIGHNLIANYNIPTCFYDFNIEIDGRILNRREDFLRYFPFIIELQTKKIPILFDSWLWFLKSLMPVSALSSSFFL